MAENKADYAIKGMERDQQILGKIFGNRVRYTQRITTGGWK
jgi:hypothetical protein